ncbi:MAG: LytR family transcriptional regulator [Ruminococcus sp.]|nr:LytR family transcriptional regulator [Ruminococcus sp.]
MSYREEPTLQELIAGSIEKKKNAKVKLVRVSKKEHTKSFKIENHREIGEEFIDRSQFRNAQPRKETPKKVYNAEENLDPEFLKSLKENFGNSGNYKRRKPKKQEFKLQIVDNEYDTYPDEPVRNSVKVRRLPSDGYNGSGDEYVVKEKTKGNLEMRKYDYDDFDEDIDDDYIYDENFDEAEYEEVPEKKRKKRHFFRNFFLLILILLLIAGAILYAVVDKYAKLFNYVSDGERLEIQNVVRDEKVFNLLLIGTDARDDGRNGLSDSMILMSINEETNEVVLTSFMRDCNVQIPGMNEETWHKLNWAHSKGGPELLMDTLEFNFGVEIDYYAKVNFLSFAKIIDAVGGLQIEITDAEAVAMIDPMAEQNKLLGNEKGTDYLYEGGSYHMNGNQALAYARIRKNVGDDFKRTDRQREVLSLISEKIKGFDVKKIDSLLETIIPEITTNMEINTVKKLIVGSPFYLKYNHVSQRVPYGDNGESWSYGSTADGSVIILDFDLNKKKILETIYRK